MSILLFKIDDLDHVPIDILIRGGFGSSGQHDGLGVVDRADGEELLSVPDLFQFLHVCYYNTNLK